MKYIIVLVMMLILTPAQAECVENFFKEAPQVVNPMMQEGLTSLCFEGFAVQHSATTKTPLWSASHLTRERVQDAQAQDRQDNFHEETRLEHTNRASLSDYRGSGYDRGHLSPNGDMANRSQQYDSFSLANIAPQSPYSNRTIWSGVEKDTRDLALDYGEVYTVTGVAFAAKRIKILKGNVLVPTHFFKAVYVPSTDEYRVYLAPNDESGRLHLISLENLKEISGIDAFPSTIVTPPEPKVESTPYEGSVSNIRIIPDTEVTPLERKPSMLSNLITFLKSLFN